MARYNIKIKTPLNDEFSLTPIVASGTTTSILTGEPTKAGASGAVSACVDADGTSSQRFTGVAKSDSTETASTAGVVQVYLPLPGIIYACKAKTASLANTQALIDALFCKRVIFDLTSGVWSIDTAAADSATNTINIVGGEYQTSTIWFTVATIGNMFH